MARRIFFRRWRTVERQELIAGTGRREPDEGLRMGPGSAKHAEDDKLWLELLLPSFAQIPELLAQLAESPGNCAEIEDVNHPGRKVGGE